MENLPTNTPILEFHSPMYISSNYKDFLTAKDNRLLNSIFDNIRDFTQINYNLEKLFIKKTYNYKQSVIAWLSFFKDNSTPNNPALHSVIQGFTYYLIHFNDFKLLSDVEIQICCTNFKIALNSKIDFCEKNIENDLVINTILLAKYPNLQQSTLEEALYHYNIDEDERTLFNRLFCKNNELCFLGFNFNYCTPFEIDLSIKLVQGKSLRKLLKGRIDISKTENALFHTHPYYLWNETNNILERYCTVYKILKYAPNHREYLYVLIKSCRLYSTNLKLFKEDLEFWISVFLFLIKYNINDIYKSTGIIDYLIEKRYNNDSATQFSLKGKTINSINRAVDYWHNVEIPQQILQEEEIKRKHNLKIEKNRKNPKSWQGMKLPNWQKDIFIIEEIKHVKRLAFEGNFLNHCVYTYLQDCLANRVHIFSYHKIEKEKTVPILTIEVIGKQVRQVSGKYNRSPSNTEKKHLKEWALANGLKYFDR